MAKTRKQKTARAAAARSVFRRLVFAIRQTVRAVAKFILHALHARHGHRGGHHLGAWLRPVLRCELVVVARAPERSARGGDARKPARRHTRRPRARLGRQPPISAPARNPRAGGGPGERRRRAGASPGRGCGRAGRGTHCRETRHLHRHRPIPITAPRASHAAARSGGVERARTGRSRRSLLNRKRSSRRRSPADASLRAIRTPLKSANGTRAHAWKYELAYHPRACLCAQRKASTRESVRRNIHSPSCFSFAAVFQTNAHTADRASLIQTIDEWMDEWWIEGLINTRFPDPNRNRQNLERLARRAVRVT